MNLKTDQTLVDVHVHIRGVATTSKIERDETIGVQHETERQVTRTVADEPEFDRAKKLESQYRHAASRFVVNTRIGALCANDKIEELRAALAPIEGAIANHNATAKVHVIEADCVTLPINVALDANAVKALCAQVARQVDEVSGALKRGDQSAVRAWLLRNANLPGLMPALIEQALTDAISDVKRNLAHLRTRSKAGDTVEAQVAGLDFTMLDAARGMVAIDAAQVAPPASVESTATVDLETVAAFEAIAAA